ncbi:MAG: SpoIID/LytB domain-containing protein [Leptospira sp.]|jgi:stage II sporulation protein D|nr:SpoIID/LytB domain-containing protein [Leptospira sp.]NCS94115.1 SpoIID/LytB domain-containing protein [Leptospira sp.]
MRRLTYFPFIFVFIVFSSCIGLVTESWKPPATINESLIVRVYLGKPDTELKVTTNGIFQVFDVNDLMIKKNIDILQLNPFSLKARIRIVPESGMFTYNGKKYRGEISIEPTQQGPIVLNLVPIEKYLIAVVPSEVPYSWPEEALKAQAICARTYVIREMLNKVNQNYDVDVSTASQVYGGVDKENPRTTKAVEETEGTLMLYKNEPIHAFFHSNAGGMTEKPENVWGGKNLPYLDHIESKYDQYAPNYSWSDKIRFSDADRLLAKEGVGKIESILVLGRNLSQRVELVEIIGETGTKKIKGADFRKIIGNTKLKSLKFGIKKEADGYFIKGLGNGHGVGMSQWGAHGMAEENYNYRAILKHYYPGIDLANMVR